MKKRILPVLCALLLFSGCVNGAPEQPVTEPTAPTVTESPAEPTVPMEGTLPDSVVTPDEMPGPPEADAEIPPQPQPPVVTQ